MLLLITVLAVEKNIILGFLIGHSTIQKNSQPGY